MSAEAPRGWPVVGVAAVVIHEGKVLLIRRAKEPLRGVWIVPGGTVEPGETLERALVREIEEETGWRVEVGELLALFDRIERGDDGSLRYHFVIADYLCTYRGGELRAGSDADDVALVPPDALDGYALPEKARELVEEGLRRWRLARLTESH